jgi:YVTN family beta-propeller protein
MINKFYKSIYAASFIAISIFSGCKKDDNDPGTTAPAAFNKSSGLYISCEGNFQSANSSVYYYNPSDNSLVDDVYQTVNGHTPGDVLQSLKLINNSLYLVVNNSGKILVCNPNTLKETATISGFTSPRYILPVDSTKAYVTDLFTNTVTIINPVTNTITATIPMTATTEQMAMTSGSVFVTSFNSEYVYLINPLNDQLTDSIHISKGGVSAQVDMNNKLWVLCTGDYLGAYNGALYRIDPVTKAIELSLSFNASEYPSRLCMNAAKDELYFINNHVYRMSISDTAIPTAPFIPSNFNSFYGLAIDPHNNDVYVSDAIDFSQKGKAYRYNSSGTLLNTINTGVVPGDFLFFY